MGIKEDIAKVEKKMQEVENYSVAMEFVQDYKRTNKRMFIIIIVILCMWFATIGYLVYLLNDINTSVDTIDIEDVESIDNSHIKIGDDIWEKSE